MSKHFLLGLSLVAGTAIQVQAQQKSGAAKFKVTDDQHFNLTGANIEIPALRLSSFTNAQGEALFSKLNEGDYDAKISFIGYTGKTVKIKVKAGSVVEIKAELRPNAQTNENVVIVGDRLRGQAKALNQQKNAFNITNIIAADQIGRFPDANIGDAIKRVPGITMQNDQGEARNIIVRGMGPELNSVSLNGERIPSAEGDNRRVQMDLIPSDMVQTVEVNKTLTPEMDADAIGGSVNLLSRAAANGLRVSATVAGGINPIRDGFIGTTNLVIGNRFANNKLGAVISGSFNTNDYGSDNIEAIWAKDANGKLYISQHDLRVYDVKRVRRATSATIDYKINPRNTLFLTGSYAWRDDLENRFRLRQRFRGNAGNLIYGADGEITGFRNGEVVRQTKGGLNSNRNENRRLEDQRVKTVALRGDHLWGSLHTDWNLQYAKASEVRPNERYIAMRRRSSGLVFNQDIANLRYPNLLNTEPLTAFTTLSELTEQFQNQFEEDINGKINFTLPLSWLAQQNGQLKFGGRIRSKLKVRDNDFYSFTPTSANAPNFANMSLLPLENRTDDNFLAGEKYKAGSFIQSQFLGDMNLNDAALFNKEQNPEEFLAVNYKAKEIISAFYAQHQQQLSKKLSMLVGVRAEFTNTDYTGNVVEDEDTFKEAIRLKNNYVNILPSVNFRYEADKQTVVRAALTSGIARPKYYELAPYFNVSPNDQTLSSGNPSLQPIKAINIDLMAERYFNSIGLISGGIFMKQLDGFYYTYRDDNYTSEKFATDFPNVSNPIPAGDVWQYAQTRNGGKVDVIGGEIAYQRQLDFLPGFWKGFGVYANYTYTHSKADGIYDAEGKLIRSDVTLPGTAPHTYNASLSYENKRLVARVSANFTSAYVDDSDDGGYNADAFFDRYYDKQFFLDANASYAFTKQWRVFAEANNLTNQPLRYYQGASNRTAQLEYYGPRFNMGIKFDFNK